MICFKTSRDPANYLDGVADWFTDEQFANLVRYVWRNAYTGPGGAVTVFSDDDERELRVREEPELADVSTIDELIALFIRHELQADPADYGLGRARRDND